MGLKILHILYDSLPYVQAGYSIRSHYIAKIQKKMGYEPFMATRPGFPNIEHSDFKEKEYIDGIPYFHNEMMALDFRLIRKIAHITGIQRVHKFNNDRLFRRYLLNIAKNYKIEIIQPTSPASNVFPAVWVGKKRRIPVVYEVRGVWEDTSVALGKIALNSEEYRVRKELETEAMKRVDAVVTLSQAMKEDFVSRGIPSEKIYIVPNGIDSKVFSPQEKEQSLVEKMNLEGKIVLSYIGSLRKIEGLEYLIKSLPNILQKNSNTKALIVGDGDEREKLELLSKELGLERDVIFTGRVPHDDIIKYYALIDIFVIPRINCRVNNLVTPLKPYEAMAMEKTVLVSNVGGLKEIVDDGKTGLCFEAENVNDLTNKCLKLINNHNLRDNLGKQAREWVVKHHDRSVVVSKYKDVYTALLNGKG